MIRRLLRTLATALLSGFLVFATLFVAAWVNHRGDYNFSSNQRFSRFMLGHAASMIREYQKTQGSLPEKLTDLPQVRESKGSLEEVLMDGWDRPLQYHPQETSYELFSFGRDGKPGGIGLDADLYLDKRNRELAIVTFSQYLQEDDDSNVKRNTFLGVATEAGTLVALAIFISFWMAEKSEDKKSGTPAQKLKLSQTILYVGVTVLISSAVGMLLLPVHLSTGH
ncbi:Bacterial type II secretion system protein G [Gimesia chilikensis]|uniref:Bacterial type II secretion system protein G n=1 Tax=Gimesia chilikensis TaxID=2605989 RepID=A0A517WBK3_9PLAN|nr:type II secretion system protein GspG [Gimesia chilikensis]QDU02644.1 Bacterial type II secretion system protein G [Gimesia chilikensis]